MEKVCAAQENQCIIDYKRRAHSTAAGLAGYGMQHGFFLGRIVVVRSGIYNIWYGTPDCVDIGKKLCAKAKKGLQTGRFSCNIVIVARKRCDFRAKVRNSPGGRLPVFAIRVISAGAPTNGQRAAPARVQSFKKETHECVYCLRL